VLDPIAWFCGNSGSVAHAVGTKSPNAWGLYDVLGNAWEWCYESCDSGGPDDEAFAATDPWSATTGTFRVDRGGCLGNEARDVRLAHRGNNRASASAGFRPVRTLP
jgi:formylglycine-generating enzyme required for sulfatase activity